MTERAHTILLIQTGAPETRTFSDFESVTECVAGINKMYEDYLKFRFPQIAELTYELADLMHFIDALPDLSCLVFERTHNMYIPYTTPWIKEQVYNNFTKTVFNDL